MKQLLFTLVVFSWSGIISSQPDATWHQKISSSLLSDVRNGQSAPFLIVLRKQADLREARHMGTKEAKGTFVYNTLRATAAESQQAIIHFLEERAAPYQTLYVLNAIRTEGALSLLEALAQRPDVAALAADPLLRYTEPVTQTADNMAPRSALEWGLERIQADKVWDMGYRGQGVVVGGQDTGYDWMHPALKRQYRGYDADADTAVHDYHWHDAIHDFSPVHGDTLNSCGLDVQEPCDDQGHGTHTMGTMIGLDGPNQIGVAPEATWCACRNMERGWGSPFTYLECFQWFLAPTDLNNENPDPDLAPHVINNSWGCPEVEGCDSLNRIVLDMAVEAVRAAGIVVVVSAGNSGSACSTVSAPAAIYEGAFSVGATRSNDTIAGFSSRGPVMIDGSQRLKPNVSAPGAGIRSAQPGGAYGNASGTSMAAPHVAGLVALMISANPALAGEVDLIEDIIEQTAVPKTTDQQCGDIPGSEVPNHTYGYGRIDALAAVEAALALIETSTGESPAGHGLRAYPNPVQDRLTLALETPPAKTWSVVLSDMQGQARRHLQGQTRDDQFIRIDMTGLPVGLYAYRLVAGNQIYTGTVVRL